MQTALSSGRRGGARGEAQSSPRGLEPCRTVPSGPWERHSRADLGPGKRRACGRPGSASHLTLLPPTAATLRATGCAAHQWPPTDGGLLGGGAHGHGPMAEQDRGRLFRDSRSPRQAARCSADQWQSKTINGLVVTVAW